MGRASRFSGWLAGILALIFGGEDAEDFAQEALLFDLFFHFVNFDIIK
jgi:hypothetical protein